MDEDRITGTVKKVAGQAESLVGDVTGDTKTQASGRFREAGGTIENLIGQAKDTARQVAGQASDYAGQALETGRRYVDEGRERLPEADRYYQQGTRAVTRQVEENPLLAIVAAGAVGYLLALLIHRR